MKRSTPWQSTLANSSPPGHFTPSTPLLLPSTCALPLCHAAVVRWPLHTIATPLPYTVATAALLCTTPPHHYHCPSYCPTTAPLPPVAHCDSTATLVTQLLLPISIALLRALSQATPLSCSCSGAALSYPSMVPMQSCFAPPTLLLPPHCPSPSHCFPAAPPICCFGLAAPTPSPRGHCCPLPCPTAAFGCLAYQAVDLPLPRVCSTTSLPICAQTPMKLCCPTLLPTTANTASLAPTFCHGHEMSQAHLLQPHYTLPPLPPCWAAAPPTCCPLPNCCYCPISQYCSMSSAELHSPFSASLH